MTDRADAWGIGAKSGRDGGLEYHSKDFWREENAQFGSSHHRLEKSARIIEQMSRGRECTLLDVGCGPATLMRLLPPNVRYYGIDIAISTPAANLIEADILRTPISFGDMKFDIVSAQGVFEYLGDFQLEKFGEIADILKPGGKFLVTFWNFGHRRAHVHDSFSHVQSLTDFRRALERYFSVDRCLPVSHNWRHHSPSRPFIKAVNMRVNTPIPLISSMFAVEYLFICDRTLSSPVSSGCRGGRIADGGQPRSRRSPARTVPWPPVRP